MMWVHASLSCLCAFGWRGCSGDVRALMHRDRESGKPAEISQRGTDEAHEGAAPAPAICMRLLFSPVTDDSLGQSG